MSSLNYKFANLLGAPYRGGNLLLHGTELLSAVGNRVSEVRRRKLAFATAGRRSMLAYVAVCSRQVAQSTCDSTSQSGCCYSAPVSTALASVLIHGRNCCALFDKFIACSASVAVWHRSCFWSNARS